MQDIDIIYMYEYAARELDVACAVKHIAQKKYGLRAEIVQWPCGYNRVYGRFNPRVVVLPFCYTSRSFVRCLLDWREAIYFNMSWEQLFYKGNRIAKAPHGGFPLNHVIHHAWGDFYADFLKEKGVHEEHIFVNGHPAYALYQEPYRRYFKNRMELSDIYGLDPNKKWVFFPENYNWAFFPEPILERFIRDGQSPEDVSALRDYCCSTLTEVVRWLDELARGGDTEVIIRPRPSILLEDLKAFILKTVPSIPDRMHLIEGESVRDWILASDVVVSSYSTSLIEAATAGKEAYILEPYDIPSVLFVEWQRLLPHIKTKTEFIATCSGNPKEGGGRQLKDWAKATVMGRDDAIQNLVQYLARLCQGDIPHPPGPSRKDVVEWLNWPIPSWLLFELMKIGVREGRRTPFRKIEPEFVKDFVSQEEIERRVGRWAEILSGA